MNDEDPIDMSPEAIDRRLREVGQLYRLGRELASARWVDPGEPSPGAEPSNDPSAVLPRK